MPRGSVLKVAVPSPLRRCFDYLPPAGVAPGEVPRGARVRVPFGRSTRVGLVVGVAEASEVPAARLRRVREVLDAESLLPAELLDLLEWASTYYHHPPGEVVQVALPAALRRGRRTLARGVRCWRLTAAGAAADPAALARAPRQAQVLAALAARPQGAGVAELQGLSGDWRGALRALVERGWARAAQRPAGRAPRRAAPGTSEAHAEPAQQQAIEAVAGAGGGFHAFLLEGVTGSGKTEVYLQLIGGVLQAGRQALVLVPEIGLTPQMVARFRERLGAEVAVLHSGLSDEERLAAWLAAREGRAGVVIGTRSAVFTPLPRPGLLVVDEEHDLSFKQQEGFRYSARDLAVFRARQAGVPVVLGSATPSLESLQNVAQGRYRRLALPRRAGGAAEPDIRVLDVRARPFADGLSPELLEAVAATLARGEQALLFLNRRGFAPVLLCHACGWVADCERCDAHMVYHRGAGRLRCHHCGREQPAGATCPGCGGGDLRALGTGTERTAQALARHFPQARIARLDRDSTRRRGALDSVLESIHRGETDLLVGTQMLAKGHHFPQVTLVGILDADGGLFGADFRASERMAQLVVQVAGRAGRGLRPGRVLVQTHHPDHPLLQALIRHGYARFAEKALAERREAGLPPWTWHALLRAEAPSGEACRAFLEEAQRLAEPHLPAAVVALGPVAAPMERRAGRYRYQLLLEAQQRGALHRVLTAWVPALEGLRSARRVRWSLDVDPQDML